MTVVTERCLQCMLLVACVLVWSFDLATPVSCQGGCIPPLVTPGYMDPITITNGSWAPTTSVTVKIDERYFLWGTTVVNRIQDGEVKWNSPLTILAFRRWVTPAREVRAALHHQPTFVCGQQVGVQQAWRILAATVAVQQLALLF